MQKKKISWAVFYILFWICYLLHKKIKINFFDEIFSDYDNFNSNLKVINKKYIEYINMQLIHYLKNAS